MQANVREKLQGQSGMILDKTHARDLGNSCKVSLQAMNSRPHLLEI